MIDHYNRDMNTQTTPPSFAAAQTLVVQYGIDHNCTSLSDTLIDLEDAMRNGFVTDLALSAAYDLVMDEYDLTAGCGYVD